MGQDKVSIALEKVLLENEILSEAELQEAKRHSEEQNVSLPQALIELEAIGYDDLAAIVAESMELRELKLEDVDIDRESVRHVPASVAYRHTLIPVRRSGSTLVVVMADPTNPAAMDALRRVTDFEIVAFVGRMDAIEHALHIHYGEPPEDVQTNPEEVDQQASDRVGSCVVDERFAHIGRSQPLNRVQTFESFIDDPGNRHAVSVARSVVSGQTDERTCPIVLQGEAGSGKTHLLHAIGNYLTAKQPLDKFLLSSGEQFSRNLFDCVRNRKVNLFRYFYREPRFLLLDDADVFLTRPWAQRELAATIQHLNEAEGWVLLSTVEDWSSEGRVVPELRGLLESGTVARFEECSLEGRIQIVQKQIGESVLSDDVIARLTSEIAGSMRELLEIAQQFAAISVLESREVTEDVLTDLLALHGAEGRSEESKPKKRGTKSKSKAKAEAENSVS